MQSLQLTWNTRLGLLYTVFEFASQSVRSGDVLSGYLFLVTDRNSTVGFIQGVNGVLQASALSEHSRTAKSLLAAAISWCRHRSLLHTELTYLSLAMSSHDRLLVRSPPLPLGTDNASRVCAALCSLPSRLPCRQMPQGCHAACFCCVWGSCWGQPACGRVLAAANALLLSGPVIHGAVPWVLQPPSRKHLC